MAQIIRAEIAVGYDIENRDPHRAVIRHNIPIMTWAPGGSVYLTPQENEAALRAAAQAFVAALPTNRGYSVAASLVSEANTPI
ncbi:hypothetical protein ACIQU6_05600 [Streptomyces sp. NPDC090442]|uniref:hypothetical protein n=1 Tax=Streptomyces sp. NPDC090442 TaxID=3365962 RepID=UPI0037FEEABF